MRVTESLDNNKGRVSLALADGIEDHDTLRRHAMPGAVHDSLIVHRFV